MIKFSKGNIRGTMKDAGLSPITREYNSHWTLYITTSVPEDCKNPEERWLKEMTQLKAAVEAISGADIELAP